ncbi:hypothetical protein BDZ89DRAFT_1135273 [Hymenopellis radicata]|nr:hypothetical protein BDZ89DRAFT_1135273 [Hymenopellis radicata]
MNYPPSNFPSTVPYSYGPGLQPTPIQSELDFAMFDAAKLPPSSDPANASSVGARPLPPSPAVQDFSHFSMPPPPQQQQQPFPMSYAPPPPQQQQPIQPQYMQASPGMPWTQQFNPGWNSPAAQMGYTALPPQAYYHQPQMAYPMHAYAQPTYMQHPMYPVPAAPMFAAAANLAPVTHAPEPSLTQNATSSDTTPSPQIKKEPSAPIPPTRNDRLQQTTRTVRQDNERRQYDDNDSDDERHYTRARRTQRRSASPPRRNRRERSRSRTYSPPRYISSPLAPRTIPPRHREPKTPTVELRDGYPNRVNTIKDARQLFDDAQIEGNFHKLFMLRAYQELLFNMRDVFTVHKYSWAFPAHRQPSFHPGFRELTRLLHTDGPGGKNLPRLPDAPIPVPPPVTGSGANVNFFGYAMYSILHARPWNVVGALITTHLACPTTIFGLQMQQMVVPPFGDYSDKLQHNLWHWKISAAYFSANPPAYGKEIERLGLNIEPVLSLSRLDKDFVYKGDRDGFVAHYASCGATEATWHATEGFGFSYLAWATDPRNIRNDNRLNDFARDLLFRALASKIAYGFPPPWTTVRDAHPTSLHSIPLDLTSEPLAIPGDHDDVLDRRRRIACQYPLRYIDDRHRPSTRKKKAGTSRHNNSPGPMQQSEDVVMSPNHRNTPPGPSSSTTTTNHTPTPVSTLDAMAPEFTVAIADLMNDMDVNQSLDDDAPSPSHKTESADSDSEDE